MSDPQNTISTPPTSYDLTGNTVGRFFVKSRIGAGGMGQVYRAEDTMLKRIVAIKRMAPQLQVQERDRDRFLKEAQRASALNHPNIAAIYDVLQEKGEILLVMEYVEGKTLRHRIKSPISIPEFLEIAIQCAEGLGAAHDQRIVHKDIKPENIMLTAAQRVKILDFGVAMRFVVDQSEATQSFASMTASLSGTPGYMAPEVLQQRPYDGRADLFSLGLVFYEMLGGDHPFTTDSFAGTLARVLHREPPSLSEVNRTVPTPLAGIVQHLLAKDPEQRYQSAETLLTDLRAVQSGAKPTYARLASERSYHLASRWKVLLGAAVIALLLALFFFKDKFHRTSEFAAATKAGLPDTKSLAILPIVASANDPKFAAFGNGLVETLTAKLNQLGENHSVQVVPASEMLSKHVATLDQARQEFGVNLGLRVGLEQSGDMVRANYTLIDAKTGLALASKSFDAPISDPFTIEDRVANGAAAALGVELRPEERRELISHGTSIPEAYNYYLQAHGYLDDPFKPENALSAITVFTEALKLDPNYGTARAGLGLAYWWKYYSTKDKQAVALARETCSKAVESGTAGAEGHICLGIVENGTGGYEQAVAQFQKAVELEPTNDQAYAGLASAYKHLNKLDEAEKTYQRVIEIRPQYSRAYINLGGFYLQQQQYGKAIDMFNRAVALSPDSYRGYSDLGAAYLSQAKYADAIKPLEQSIAIRPSSDAYNNLGTAYLRLRRYPDAVRAYQAAVKLDEGEYIGWGSLGDALHYNGNGDAAKKAYETAITLAKRQLEVNPKDAEVLGDVADYYAMVSDRKNALASLDQSLQWGHGDKDLLFNAAVVYQDLGESGEALEWMKKSLNAGYPAASVREVPSFDPLKNDPRFKTLVLGQSN
jgi:serine/threonine protein kinase/tetratricopeptide (TPR) repeat protein